MPSFLSKTTLLAVTLLCAAMCVAQQQDSAAVTPTSGGYKPPALSPESLLETDKMTSNAIMAYAVTGDSAAFRETIESAAGSGDLGAEIFLASQYLPEQCTFQPDRDVPACGPDGKQPQHVIFRTNPLKIPASYENAAQWFGRASAQGSGEASEMLAQLITRMLANGHPTSYTAADSTRLHALARSRNFDVERIVLTCYRLRPGAATLALAGPQPEPLLNEAPPAQSISPGELRELQTAGVRGALDFKGANVIEDSSLLERAEGPIVHIRVILDHEPGHEIHLPIPARHDVIYLQRGDRFVNLPSAGQDLSRFVSIMPQPSQQVCVRVQNIYGQYSGICTGFSDRLNPGTPK